MGFEGGEPPIYCEPIAIQLVSEPKSEIGRIYIRLDADADAEHYELFGARGEIYEVHGVFE